MPILRDTVFTRIVAGGTYSKNRTFGAAVNRGCFLYEVGPIQKLEVFLQYFFGNLIFVITKPCSFF